MTWALISDHLGCRGETIASIQVVAFVTGALTVLIAPRLIGRLLKSPRNA